MCAWTLCSKMDVINKHPCTEEELKDQWSDEVEALIRQHMGAPYLGQTQVITDEYHDGDGTHILRVKNPPIISVESLTVNSILLSSSDYVVFSGYIELRAQIFPKDILNIMISYTSGSVIIDPTVQLCAAAMIIAILNYRRRAGADASLKWAVLDTETGEKTPNLNVGLTSHLLLIMRRTLRRHKLRVR